MSFTKTRRLIRQTWNSEPFLWSNLRVKDWTLFLVVSGIIIVLGIYFLCLNYAMSNPQPPLK